MLRVIARLNVGGPALHVTLLSGRLAPERYETVLVTGRVGAGEASSDALAQRYGAAHRVIDGLGAAVRPFDDLRALRELIGTMRAFRPAVVHTHTAKAGLLGRVAARIALGRRPVVVHTFHGHVLTGYFGPLRSAALRWVERALALLSDRIVAVSQAVADDLVRLRVAPPSRFVVVPLGLELDGFAAATPEDARPVRLEVGAGDDDVLVAVVGRLVPIKRVDVALDGFVAAAAHRPGLRLAIVGDGPERAALEAQASASGLGDRVRFLGFRDDIVAVHAAADIALLTSDNEGTPVALIEAAATGTPAVATTVGGVADVVTPVSGRLVAAGDAPAVAAALGELSDDADLRHRLGHAASTHVMARFGAERLLREVDALYARELARRARP